MNTLLQENISKIPQQRSPVLFDGGYGIYLKENFKDILAFEEKYSKSSGKPFLLMKLTVFGISDLQGMRDIIRGAVEALLVFSREIYVKGWYRDASTFGVIFTEMADRETETLREKIYRGLGTHLTEAQVDAIHISFHSYPDDESSAMPGNPRDFTFYPDSFKYERSKKVAFTMKRILHVIGNMAGI